MIQITYGVFAIFSTMPFRTCYHKDALDSALQFSATLSNVSPVYKFRRVQDESLLEAQEGPCSASQTSWRFAPRAQGPGRRVKSSFSLGTGWYHRGRIMEMSEVTPPFTPRSWCAWCRPGPNPTLYYCNARSYGCAVSRLGPLIQGLIYENDVK